MIATFPSYVLCVCLNREARNKALCNDCLSCFLPRVNLIVTALKLHRYNFLSGKPLPLSSNINL